jgi:hypothetical protein
MDKAGRYLFIGGTLDRQFVDVGAGEKTHHVDRTKEEYVSEPIVLDGRLVVMFFRESSVRMEEVLISLMAAYADKEQW